MKKTLFEISGEKYTTIGHQDYNSISVYAASKEPGLAPKHSMFVQKWYSNEQDVFIKNYANILTYVNKSYFLFLVEKCDNKVSMKLFRGERNRKVGKKFFKVTKYLNYLTVNLVSGDVYHGFLDNYHSKKNVRKKIYKNDFRSEPLNQILSILKNNWNLICNSNMDNSETTNKLKMTEATMCFLNEIYKGEVDEMLYENKLSFNEILFKYYLDKKKIKYPNNFYSFHFHLYGKEFRTLLKKNENKLVETFMKYHNISGKKIKRALHQSKKLNISLYKEAIEMFGENWINQESNDTLVELLNSHLSPQFKNDSVLSFATHEEMKKIYLIFKEVYIRQTMDSWTFRDHLRMYASLKNYGETDIKWTCSYQGTKFMNEHYDWSEKLSFYQNGVYFRSYPSYFYDILQTKRETNAGVYFPVLLDSTNNYNEESQTQSNCVKGYVGKPGSIIISLRKNSSSSDERATIEYKIHKEKNTDSVLFSRVQTLGRFNNFLDSTWDDVLLSMDKLFEETINDVRFETVKLKKICNNNVELNSDTEWDELGRLTWSHKAVNNDLLYAI